MILASLLALVLTGSALAQDYDANPQPRQPRGITVTGMAEVRVAPNIAYVTAGATTTAADAQRAAADNAAIMNRVMQALKRLGIADKDIETTQYSLQPNYEYQTNGSRKQVGYVASNLVRITVRDLSKVGPVVDATTVAGANNLQGVTFGINEATQSQVKTQALMQATQDAKAKASAIASAAGVAVGPLLSASESSPSVISPMYSRAEVAAAAPTPISPQQVSVTATVSLVYSIVQLQR